MKLDVPDGADVSIVLPHLRRRHQIRNHDGVRPLGAWVAAVQLADQQPGSGDPWGEWVTYEAPDLAEAVAWVRRTIAGTTYTPAQYAKAERR